MENEKQFIPVMLTPFTEDGHIDWEGLHALIEFYLLNGARGLFANCQSSEMFDLTPDERLQLVSYVLKVVDGRVPVVASGNFGQSVLQQAASVKQIYQLGVQAVVILTCLLADKQEDDFILEQRISELLTLTGDIPLGFYECPLPYKRILSPALLSKFVHTAKILYHKDTSLNIDQVRLKNNLCMDASRFGLYDAYMAHAVKSLNAGSKGLSCIQGNYFPELVVWLCQNYNKPTLHREVKLVQDFFTRQMDVMHRDYPKSAKYYLQKRGLPIAAYTRQTANNDVSLETKQQMDHLMTEYQLLADKIDLVAPF